MSPKTKPKVKGRGRPAKKVEEPAITAYTPHGARCQCVACRVQRGSK